MLRFYPIVVLIQIFCVYHAYSKKSDQKWYWIIIVFPMIGSILYLYHHFYSRRNLEIITEEVKGTIIENYTIDKLEQKVKYSNTYSNKMELANEHLRVGNYVSAIEIFESCNTGTYQDDPQLIMKLIQSNYLNKNYNQVIAYGNRIEGSKEFRNSPERTALAWSNYHIGELSKAEKLFNKMDIKFSNYENRLEYAYFLQESKGDDEARIKTEELLEELESMDSYERRGNKKVIQQIKYLYRQL